MSAPAIAVENHGTVWVFDPLNEKGRIFLRHKVQTESWQWLGGRLVIDHRPARGLVEYLDSQDVDVLGPGVVVGR